MKQTWDNKEKLENLAKSYTNVTKFIKENGSAWNAARRMGIEKAITAHMIRKTRKGYAKEELAQIASSCENRAELKKKNQSAYNAARALGILDEICSHMPEPLTEAYTYDELRKIAKNCDTKNELRNGYPGAYTVICDRGLLEELCIHMPEVSNRPWTYDELQEEALKYEYRVDFENGSNSAYNIAVRLKIIDKICSHMKKHRCSSGMEKELFSIIKKHYISTKKLKDRKIKIDGKPYITGFEIDIFVPELNLGIEFDGKYYHSFKYMRKDKRKIMWSDEDIKNYHKIKDDWFLNSKNIKILHIKEEDWIKNKQKCIDASLNFLGIKTKEAA